MDEDTRHVVNLGDYKKVHTHKESFYNKD
ncbi:Uncharacterized protein BWGO95_01083 [Bacillus mycoides]|uniref:Uncharacterized protein n=1 Tax=Bacillus mycoides TaxID=1405 RepID=A0A1G4EDU0_BACMY|nr:Uncharacterized protein BWGO95_01083 [Bacillus mycoides]